jgi:hypothetical protein
MDHIFAPFAAKSAWNALMASAGELILIHYSIQKFFSTTTNHQPLHLLFRKCIFKESQRQMSSSHATRMASISQFLPTKGKNLLDVKNCDFLSHKP